MASYYQNADGQWYVDNGEGMIPIWYNPTNVEGTGQDITGGNYRSDVVAPNNPYMTGNFGAVSNDYIRWDGGAGQPVYFKQPDGTWKNVGAPEHLEGASYIAKAVNDPQVLKVLALYNANPALLNNEQKAFIDAGALSLDSFGQGYRWGAQNLFDNVFSPQQAGGLLQTGFGKYLSDADKQAGLQFNYEQSPAQQSARSDSGGLFGDLGPLLTIGGLALGGYGLLNGLGAFGAGAAGELTGGALMDAAIADGAAMAGAGSSAGYGMTMADGSSWGTSIYPNASNLGTGVGELGSGTYLTGNSGQVGTSLLDAQPATVNQMVGQATGALNTAGQSTLPLIPGVNAQYDFGTGAMAPAVSNASGSLTLANSLSPTPTGFNVTDALKALSNVQGLLGGGKQQTSGLLGGSNPYAMKGISPYQSGILQLQAPQYQNIFGAKE